MAQKLIQEIMDLSVSIQALEEQNKIRFPGCVMERRKQVNSIKANSRAVTNYYKNMPNTHQAGQSYFVDKKIKIFQKIIKYFQNNPIYKTSK